MMPSTYVTSFTLSLGGVGISEVYRLNSVDESTPPGRTPVLIVACFDLVFLHSVYGVRSSEVVCLFVLSCVVAIHFVGWNEHFDESFQFESARIEN